MSYKHRVVTVDEGVFAFKFVYLGMMKDTWSGTLHLDKFPRKHSARYQYSKSLILISLIEYKQIVRNVAF